MRELPSGPWAGLRDASRPSGGAGAEHRSRRRMRRTVADVRPDDRAPEFGPVVRSVRAEAEAQASGTHERRVDEVLDEKPRLQLAGADHLRDDQVIGTVVTLFGDLGRGVVARR